MSLFKKRSQTPEPEPVAEPSPKPGGKGRPTPRRKDQQAKNLHPVVPKDRAAAKREARAARDAAWERQNKAMVTGEEKYLPSREKVSDACLSGKLYDDVPFESLSPAMLLARAEPR